MPGAATVPCQLVPVEPPRSVWEFGDPRDADPDDDLVGIGADLRAGHPARGVPPRAVPDAGRRRPAADVLVLAGAARGPPAGRAGRVAVAAAARCGPARSGSTPRSRRSSTACADPRRPQGWITADIAEAYVELHRLGWAHSVEAWRDGRLVGGLYGVAIGGLFAGESMFHRERDASKVALVGLVDLLRDEHAADRLLDVQWVTPHLATLGAVEIPRAEYLDRLARALRVPCRWPHGLRTPAPADRSRSPAPGRRPPSRAGRRRG